MHRPSSRRNSLSSTISPLTLSGNVSPSPAAGGGGNGISSGLKRSASAQLLSRLSALASTAPALPSNARATPVLSPPAPGSGTFPSSSSGRRLPSPTNVPSRTAPIPISPTSPTSFRPTAPRTNLPTAGLSGKGKETSLAHALRTNDAALLRVERGRYSSPSPIPQKGTGASSDDAVSDGSGESFDVPIVDTSKGIGAPSVHATSSALGGRNRMGGGLMGGGGGGGGEAGLVGGVRYSNGRRMSSLATYTGLPQPPQLANTDSPQSYHHPSQQAASLNGRNGGGGGGEEGLRYSLSGLGSGSGRRASHAGLVSVRPPSPVGNALKPVSPLTSTHGNGNGNGGGGYFSSATTASPAVRRPSLPSGVGARRASSPAGPRPSSAALFADVAAGGGCVTSGTTSSVLSSRSSLGSSSAAAGAARRAPSPARGSLLDLNPVASTSTSRSGRAPSPARPSGLVRAASPGPSVVSPSSPPSAHSPRIVRGFDAPSTSSLARRLSLTSRSSAAARSPSPGRRDQPIYAPSSTALSRGRSASQSSHHPSVSHQNQLPPGASTYPPSSPPHHGPRPSLVPHTHHSPLTRPRSSLTNPHLDQRLEVRASRDFEQLDEYYERRSRVGRGEEGQRKQRREAEERLRRGYDRLSGGSHGVGGAGGGAA
ncbi:hypothetical protein JCM11251_000586 [Rhodosporidiobolus azoricus]